MNKAQTEIMGMVIVVILITIGLFLIISFQVARGPTEVKKQYKESQLVSNTLNVFLRTNVPECKFLDISELLRDCSFLKRVYCQGVSSCDKVNDIAKKLLTETLDKEYKDKYHFTIKHGPNEISNIGSRCPRNTESKTYPIPGEAGTTMIVRLDICTS